MPVYDFRCDRCKMKWEVKLSIQHFVTIKDDIKCNVCGEKAMNCVSPLKFRLKGEGWYNNGYGDSSSVDNPYSITQNELDRNKDQAMRLEDETGKLNTPNISEI